MSGEFYGDDDDGEYDATLPPAMPDDIRVEVSIRPPTTAQVSHALAQRVLDAYGSAAKIAEAAEETIRATIESKVADQINGVISDLLLKPLQPTDGFGSPVGEPVTLASLIQHEAKQYLTANVDYHGKLTKRGGFGDRGKTRLDFIVSEALREQFKTSIDAEVRKMVEQVKAATLASISADVAKAIAARVPA